MSRKQLVTSSGDQNRRLSAAHLEAVQADDTVPMRNVAFSEDFFCFLGNNRRKDTCSEHPVDQDQPHGAYRIKESYVGIAKQSLLSGACAVRTTPWLTH